MLVILELRIEAPLFNQERHMSNDQSGKKVDEKQVKDNLDRKIPALTDEALENVAGGLPSTGETDNGTSSTKCCW